MIARVYSAIPQGYNGHLVNVEGDTNQGLPCFNIVGMANKTITESRERVRSAIANSNLIFPQKKVTINLAPAELAKDGTHLDLPIALAILVLSQQLLPSDLTQRLFVGELSLDGTTRPIRGIINIIEAAKQANFPEVFIPLANLPTAQLVTGIKIIGVDNLSDLVLHLKGLKLLDHNFSTQTASYPLGTHVVKNTSSDTKKVIQCTQPSSNCHNVVKITGTDVRDPDPNVVKITKSGTTNTFSDNVKNTQTEVESSSVSLTPPYSYPTFDDIYGQNLAKRALAIAVAGHHNLLLSGPPGAGKSLLAQAAANLLPPLNSTEQLEIAKIYSLTNSSIIPTKRPFRSPHHTASIASIIGGGPNTKPGEISLAHHGVLFLDELPEYPRNILESLRQPLENGQITLNRIHCRTTYPARFMLIATMNPCPCGYHGDPTHECTCSPLQITNYRKHLSGPILDRIDITLHVQPISHDQLLTANHVVKNTKIDDHPSQSLQKPHPNTPSPFPVFSSFPEHIKATSSVRTAISAQHHRYHNPTYFNSSLTPTDIKNFVQLQSSALSLLQSASDKLCFSTRAYFKVIKVAQTIADLESSPSVAPEHIAEALNYRQIL